MISKKNGIEFEFLKGTGNNCINLVFIHGSGCNRFFLRSIHEEVSEYNCYFVDLPGHGNSDDTGYSFVNYVNAVSDFVRGLDNVILLGHSLGGTVVLAATARNILSVKGAVIISSGASFPKLDKEYMKKIHNNVVDMEYVAECLGHMEDPAVQEAVTKIEADKLIILDFLIDEVVDVEDCLKDIKVPITIVTGGDEILTLVEYSELIHEKVKNSKLVVIPKTRHMLPVAKRKELRELIIELIDKVI
ncbi:pimeloyl-[acyl-carrier protein] methyl ester esterase [Clostridium puniceum]|uniref:Pimeloyl-[acyl-carrier protein] methyl ester esterase n=1 Tax=Clostridium puniceum TaxID=29367 RepID=A0A1S8TY47_9CLOT|nr:alpha/beta hydrolase [Clostridium puniceum]OOM82512.1 pimeloyl-[acyl-carrier protein] methyl ester esterase [Clostridium puniceum]